MRHIHRYVLLMLALAIPTAHAVDVHKCVAEDGAVSYHSDTCPVRTRAIRSWYGRGLSEPDAGELARRETEHRRDSAYLKKLAGRKSAGGRLHVVRVESSACERIKARRDAQFRRNGNELGFEARRRWNDRVHEACR